MQNFYNVSSKNQLIEPVRDNSGLNNFFQTVDARSCNTALDRYYKNRSSVKSTHSNKYVTPPSVPEHLPKYQKHFQIQPSNEIMDKRKQKKEKSNVDLLMPQLLPVNIESKDLYNELQAVKKQSHEYLDKINK